MLPRQGSCRRPSILQRSRIPILKDHPEKWVHDCLDTQYLLIPDCTSKEPLKHYAGRQISDLQYPVNKRLLLSSTSNLCGCRGYQDSGPVNKKLPFLPTCHHYTSEDYQERELVRNSYYFCPTGKASNLGKRRVEQKHHLYQRDALAPVLRMMLQQLAFPKRRYQHPTSRAPTHSQGTVANFINIHKLRNVIHHYHTTFTLAKMLHPSSQEAHDLEIFIP